MLSSFRNLKSRIFSPLINKTWLSPKATSINIELILACLVGAVAGFSSVAFRFILDKMEYFFFDILYPWLSQYSIYLLPVIPVIGAILLIPFSLKYPGEINGYGMPRFLIRVHLKGGLIHTRTIFLKIITTAITISTGGSAGVEGPMAQIGGAAGSSIGRFFEMGSQRLKVLIACGSAAAIAAQFNAPLAGVLFAQEIIMVGEFQLRTFGVIVIASGLATAISRAFYSSAPTFGVLQYNLISYYELIFYIILGLLIGFLAFVFIRLFFSVSDFFSHLKINQQIKPIIGAFLVGLLGLINIGTLSAGYATIKGVISYQAGIPVTAIALLVILKMLATSITLGSGNVGGIFAPSLFIGAMIGGVFGVLINWITPGLDLQPASYALVGMGAFLAATTHAPMTAIFLLFELTGNYQVIIPIMFASVIGVMVARALCRDSMDSMELSRKGIYLHSGSEAAILNSITVESVMVKEFETLSETMSFAEFMQYFPNSKAQYYPVMDETNKMVGIVSFQDIREIMMEDGLEHLVVMGELAEKRLIKLLPHDNLTKAFKKFGIKDIDTLPVVDPNDPHKLLGLLKRKDVIDTYNRAILARDSELHE